MRGAVTLSPTHSNGQEATILSNQLKEAVESYYHRVRDVNPLWKNAAQGALSGKHIAQYLQNIHFLVQFTPIYLELAKVKSSEKGLVELAEFYAKKLPEEHGHDKWAREDMSKIAATFGHRPKDHIHPSIYSLVRYLRQVIESDPRHYLAYILLAEYFTVLIGPKWLNDLETKCGIPRSMMSVIGNHAELDKEHVKDDFRELDRLLDANEDPRGFLEVIARAAKFHDDFCAEIGSRAHE